ncbi:MAG TPA: hypothetical protein VFB04_05200 [Terriglobales bacterium]|nr:hypothetical protein [Terriglobales bacterium]
MKSLTIAVCLLAMAIPATAKPKPKVQKFNANCADVWEAAKIAVQEHYDVLTLNDQTRSGSFTTGSIWTGVRPLTFSLRDSGPISTLTSETGCEVSVTGHFSGLIHNDKAAFFNRLSVALQSYTWGKSTAAKSSEAK